MKVAIIGSRNLSSSEYDKLWKVIPSGCSEIISGGSDGADTFAEKFANKNNIPARYFVPEYEKFGKYSPLRRNDQIIESADYVVALWDGKSRGTAYVIHSCIIIGKPVKIVISQSYNEIKPSDIT